MNSVYVNKSLLHRFWLAKGLCVIQRLLNEHIKWKDQGWLHPLAKYSMLKKSKLYTSGHKRKPANLGKKPYTPKNEGKRRPDYQECPKEEFHVHWHGVMESSTFSFQLHFINSSEKTLFIFLPYLVLISTFSPFHTCMFTTKPLTDSFTTSLQLLFSFTNPLARYMCFYVCLCVCIQQVFSKIIDI